MQNGKRLHPEDALANYLGIDVSRLPIPSASDQDHSPMSRLSAMRASDFISTFQHPCQTNDIRGNNHKMSDDSSSELSSVPSEDETDLQLTKKDGILKFFSKAPKAAPAARKEDSPPRPKREPSPPHEYVLADNPDIAFIVMFRSRFNEAFPKSLPNFGPQELERDVVDTVPGIHVEQLLCALLGLLLNRKQDIKYGLPILLKAGHYNRALEEAVQTHKSQWARDWESKNPLGGGATFTTMIPTQRLTLLRTLILWSLSSSDVVKGIITTSYKQNRHEDDLNQPLSVQPWGSDDDRRRYYLIEGLDDTHFRVYRESNPAGLKRTWMSVAGDISELTLLADKLAKKHYSQRARLLSGRMMLAVPRFEATEEKRKRREYRQTRKQQFKRPEAGASMYEGRTRGKRMKYTFSDEDEEESYSDATTSRRSTRNTGTHTPAEGLGAPTVTLSGRQVKSRQGGMYGESMLSGRSAPTATVGGFDGTSEEPENGHSNLGRPKRAAASSNGTNTWTGKGGRHIEGYNDVDEMTSDEEGDASEQDYGDDEEDDAHVPLESDVDEADELSDDDDSLVEEKQSLIVKLPVKTPTPERSSAAPQPVSTLPALEFNSGSAQHPHPEQNGPSTGAAQTQPGPPAIRKTPQPADTPSSSINIPTQSATVHQSPGPSSPSLVFRGSPEKAATFQRSINVGYDVS